MNGILESRDMSAIPPSHIDLVDCPPVAALTTLKANAEVRVVILTGAGPVFSAGGDLSSMAQSQDGPTASLVELFTTMHELGKPIIAMVNGPALAGGLGLMVACDLVIASDTAVFGTTEIAVGLWPMMISAVLIRVMPRKAALELMLTGRIIDPLEAQRLGAVSRVVPRAELDKAVDETVAALRARSPATLMIGRDSYHAITDLDFDSALDRLQAGLTAIAMSDDASEGIAAFLEKREPRWA